MVLIHYGIDNTDYRDSQKMLMDCQELYFPQAKLVTRENILYILPGKTDTLYHKELEICAEGCANWQAKHHLLSEYLPVDKPWKDES